VVSYEQHGPRHGSEYRTQAERHVAETTAHVARQGQIVKDLPPNDELREEAVKMLTVLEGSLRILEQHRELIRSWLERGE
jgi:hypothetical protein